MAVKNECLQFRVLAIGSMFFPCSTAYPLWKDHFGAADRFFSMRTFAPGMDEQEGYAWKARGSTTPDLIGVGVGLGELFLQCSVLL